MTLSPGSRGLGSNFKIIRASFSTIFVNYLDSRKPWFDHITDFRDSFAHRIPLYIPPLVLRADSLERYKDISKQSYEALGRRDQRAYETLKAEQKELERFQPLMMHSLTEGSKVVIFHPQLISDLNVVEEVAREFLSEMDRSDK